MQNVKRELHWDPKVRGRGSEYQIPLAHSFQLPCPTISSPQWRSSHTANLRGNRHHHGNGADKAVGKVACAAVAELCHYVVAAVLVLDQAWMGKKMTANQQSPTTGKAANPHPALARPDLQHPELYAFLQRCTPHTFVAADDVIALTGCNNVIAQMAYNHQVHCRLGCVERVVAFVQIDVHERVRACD